MAINFIPFPVVQSPNWKVNKRQSWSQASGRWWLLDPRHGGDHGRPAGSLSLRATARAGCGRAPKRVCARGRPAGPWLALPRDVRSVKRPVPAGLRTLVRVTEAHRAPCTWPSHPLVRGALPPSESQPPLTGTSLLARGSGDGERTLD